MGKRQDLYLLRVILTATNPFLFHEPPHKTMYLTNRYLLDQGYVPPFGSRC